MRDWPLFVFFVLFVCACLFFVGYSVGIDHAPLPEAIEIRKENGETAYADIQKNNLKFVTVEDGDDPGAYLALPIYESKYD